ncbi:MAG: hypothetical protein ACR2MA_13325 [Egibacteraceae bacterium]
MEAALSATAAFWEWKLVRPGEALSLGNVSREPLREEFEQFAQRWQHETLLESMVHRIAMHPDYQRIIGLGPDVVPLILDQMAERPGHWFWALFALTGEDPARDTTTIEDATEAWLAWAWARGLR